MCLQGIRPFSAEAAAKSQVSEYWFGKGFAEYITFSWIDKKVILKLTFLLNIATILNCQQDIVGSSLTKY